MPLYEIGSGMLTSLCVAPAMTIIDTAVIKTQFTNKSFIVSCKESFKSYKIGETQFYRPFRIMFGVYSATYITANLTEFICKSNHIDYKLPTFLTTSFVNIVSIGYKDKEYAKLFGSVTKRPFPMVSFGLFSLRDMITIGSSFIIKKDVVKKLETDFRVSHRKADLISSLFIPIIAQLVSTPIHILSLDIYHSPNDLIKSRVKNIILKYPSVCIGRMLRVIPAFGIGGVINDILRPVR